MRKQLAIGAQVGAVVGVFLARADLRRLIERWRDPVLAGHGGFLLSCIAVWALFSLYWESEARKAAATSRAETTGSRAIHVFLTNAALLLVILPIRGFGRFVPASSAIMAAGVAVEALGLALAIWARRHLGRYWSGEISIKVNHHLIRTGPYGRVRHPIYTGLLLMYAGPALVTGEWLSVIGFGLATGAYWRKIRLEEANLRTAFGVEYEDYSKASWTIVPGIL